VTALKSLFYLASDLSPGNSAARHLARIAMGLNRERFQVQVGALAGSDSPLADDLRAAAIPVHAVPIRNALDWSGQRRLRNTVANAKPALVHAWGARAARSLTGIPAVALVSDASFAPPGLNGWWTVRRLRRCNRIVTSTWAEGERYHRRGVPTERFTRIAPGVAPPKAPNRELILKELGVPANARLIVVAADLEVDAGLKSAIWAFDLVRYEFPELHLAIVGDGPERESLQDFARALMFDDLRVRFASARADLADALTVAEFAWVTHERGDHLFALEAMAAGVPVIGWNQPSVAEVVEDGRSGLLVDLHDRAQLAAKTYPLLTDAAARSALGTAGRERAADRFPLARAVEHFEALYDELTDP